MDSSPVVILGAGPAGLTAAYELAKKGVRSAVLEETDTVGGLDFVEGRSVDLSLHARDNRAS